MSITLGQKTAVVALGGNAITKPGQEDTMANQFANTRASLDGVVELVRKKYGVVVTHGNGPQVGNALLRIELARGKAPVQPLGVCVADTEGGMGYMIEQSLQNRLRQEDIERQVVTIITQMLVDPQDPAIQNPTKYVGQFYTEEEARAFEELRGWQMKKDANRGWRRVVPSPTPLQAIPWKTIKKLVDEGWIVIAGGGGGIPVYIDDRGNYEGLDAVIDKDLASAVIAREIGADLLMILTAVDRVAINFDTPEEQPIDRMTVADALHYAAQGQFPDGSMGPKINAAVRFLQEGGDKVIICSLENAVEAVNGKAGTVITPE